MLSLMMSLMMSLPPLPPVPLLPLYERSEWIYSLLTD